MRTLDAVRSMLDDAGMSSYRLAMALDRDSAYFSGMLRRGSCPSGDLLAQMATACNYSLQLVPQDGAGDPIVIDGSPPAD